MSEEENEPLHLVTPSPKPPSLSSLMLERMRSIELEQEETTAVVRATRLNFAINMEEIKIPLLSINKLFWGITVTGLVIAFLLGALLVAILLK